MKKLWEWFLITLELGKIKITFSVTVTTTVGYLLAPQPWKSNLIWPVLGILLIGLSSAALNQIQDQKLDLKMKRTQGRPLPSGRVTTGFAWAYVLLYFFIGVSILFVKTNIIAGALGISAYVWYNGIYTYLKRISPIAVIPGSVIGGVPPAVGWAAAGGDILDPYILSICIFMVIWQIPHFWLLLFLYGNDYHAAGLPTLTKIISERSLQILTFIGIVLTITSAFMITFFGNYNDKYGYAITLILSVVLIYLSIGLLLNSKNILYKKTFISINIYSVLILILNLLMGTLNRV
ncbi:MAG: protoheme IX farnesyltransferase [Spirochaetia bacterium]|nr:protoheme IX farnesyltransferase [Spirochaetia bacterium]